MKKELVEILSRLQNLYYSYLTDILSAVGKASRPSNLETICIVDTSDSGGIVDIAIHQHLDSEYDIYTFQVLYSDKGLIVNHPLKYEITTKQHLQIVRMVKNCIKAIENFSPNVRMLTFFNKTKEIEVVFDNREVRKYKEGEV